MHGLLFSNVSRECYHTNLNIVIRQEVLSK